MLVSTVATVVIHCLRQIKAKNSLLYKRTLIWNTLSNEIQRSDSLCLFEKRSKMTYIAYQNMLDV